MRARPRSLGALEGTGSPRAQEERVARAAGGRRVPGSGASPFARGDAKSAHYLIECKQTEHDSIRVTWAWLEKITRQALAAGRRPALAIELRCKGARDPLVPTEWVMVSQADWQRLQELEG
jgi:Holliday junction resolvase